MKSIQTAQLKDLAVPSLPLSEGQPGQDFVAYNIAFLYEN